MTSSVQFDSHRDIEAFTLTPEQATQLTGPALDWQTVVTLRHSVAEEISAVVAAWEAEHHRPLPATDRQLIGRSVVRRMVRHHAEHLSHSGQNVWPLDVEAAYVQAVDNAIFGYGRLQPLFDIPEAENIEINGFDHVTAQTGDGQRRQLAPIADSDEELIEAIRFLGENATPARPFDDAHPTMTLALGSRFRLHAIGFGLAARPSIAIRQHQLVDVTLRDLVERGMLPRDVAALLHAAVRARQSIMIAGDQGAGKTTLLRALIDAIPHTERFGTVETDYELLTHLQPGRTNVVALQSRIGMGERLDGRPIGEVTVADLIPEALRQNLSRIIVGEVRGGEAGALIEAMQSGAGSLGTTHAHSALSTIDRLAARIAQGRVLSIDEAYRQIAFHIGFIVHIRLDDDTWRGGGRRRQVTEVLQLTGGIEHGRPVTHPVYRAADPGLPLTLAGTLGDDLAPFIPDWGTR
ncbi:MAG: CpaF family protein [Propionibacteriaceae bacterium]